MINGNASSEALHRAKYLATICILYDLKSAVSVARITQLHAHVSITGLLSPRLRSNLSRAYALRSHVQYARKLFDETPDRSPALHSSLMRMYLQKSLPGEAMQLFRRMLSDGMCRPDDFTLPFALKACGDSGRLSAGAAVHCRALAAGFASDMFIQNALLAMYLNCGAVEIAQGVFGAMTERNVVAWNTMIGGWFRNGRAGEALAAFRRMREDGVEPDSATAVAVLPACGYAGDLATGREIHAAVGSDVRANNALVDMYARCGAMGEAQRVFDGITRRDVVAWTTLINGYMLNGDGLTALTLCAAMQTDRVRPNAVTLSLLLSACAALCLPAPGRCLHCLALKEQQHRDVVVETALIDMYAKCQRVDHSHRVFANASKGNVAPWSAVIAGYTSNGLAREAVELFRQMITEGIKPNDASLNSVLPSYTALADLRQATNLHCFLKRSGILSSVEVSTALVDLYSKGGSLEFAQNMFYEIPVKSRDVIVWSVMIACHGRHGHGESAVSLFNEMLRSGVVPNEVTLTSVLHACSHSGLVDEGLALFKSTIEGSLVIPQTDHYTCVIDLLGRAGRLTEAHGIVKRAAFGQSHAVWGALLGACATHGNVELGEVAAERLFKIEPENTGNYVLMAKIYAAAGRWEDSEGVRSRIRQIGLRKLPAHSLIEVRK